MLLSKLLTIAFRYVDRDMLMRYHWGMGVGHKYTWEEETGSDAALSNTASISTISSAGQGDSLLTGIRRWTSTDSGILEAGDSTTAKNSVLSADEEVQMVEDEEDDQQESPNDGTEDLRDRENEDLGEDLSDGDFDEEDPEWDSMGHDLYED